VRNSDGAGFTFRDDEYLLKLFEVIRVGEEDAEMVGIRRDAGVGVVKCADPVARLISPLAFDTLRCAIVVTLLLKVWRSM
jgi:hypothetical protein